MIDTKKSKFKKVTQQYFKDSLFDIIDIEEALKKNKIINMCHSEDFIFQSKQKENKKTLKDLPLDEYDFLLDNGRIDSFSNYFEIKEILGEGSFGIVISAFDLKIRKENVAIKVKSYFI